jgi:hypothetical protein
MTEWDNTVEPRFFLRQCPDWTPRIVVVRRGDATEGVVYAGTSSEFFAGPGERQD